MEELTQNHLCVYLTQADLVPFPTKVTIGRYFSTIPKGLVLQAIHLFHKDKGGHTNRFLMHFVAGKLSIKISSTLMNAIQRDRGDVGNIL